MSHLQRMEFLNSNIENWVRPRIDLSTQIKMLFSFVMHSDLIRIKKNARNFYSTYVHSEFMHFLKLNFCLCELSKECIVLAHLPSQKGLTDFFFAAVHTQKKTAEKINKLCEIEGLSFMLR